VSCRRFLAPATFPRRGGAVGMLQRPVPYQYSLFRFVSTCPRGWSQPRWSYLWHEMLQRPVPESAPGNCPAASTPNPVLSLLVRVGGPSRGGAICGPECSSGQYPSPRRTLSSGQYSSPGPKTRKKKSKLFIPYTYCQLS